METKNLRYLTFHFEIWFLYGETISAPIMCAGNSRVSIQNAGCAIRFESKCPVCNGTDRGDQEQVVLLRIRFQSWQLDTHWFDDRTKSTVDWESLSINVKNRLRLQNLSTDSNTLVRSDDRQTNPHHRADVTRVRLDVITQRTGSDVITRRGRRLCQLVSNFWVGGVSEPHLNALLLVHYCRAPNKAIDGRALLN